MSAVAELEYQSFDTFRSTVQGLVAPESLAEELIPFFRDQVGNALADIQTLIPGTRVMNVSMYDKADSTEFCAASILNGPAEKITQVFAFKPGLDCRKYFYKRVDTAAIDCWQEQQRCVLCNFTDSTAIYDSYFCNYSINGLYGCDVPYITVPEDDCRFRSLGDDDRIFAVGPDRKLFLAPRFPCGYAIVVQSQGIRRKFNNADQVLIDQQIREAVVNYVEHKVALKEKDRVAAGDYFNAYTLNLRTLRYRYWDEENVEAKRDCTGAISQLMSTFQPLYQTSGLATSTQTGQGDDVQEVYRGDSPPAQPEDPSRPALFIYKPNSPFGTGMLSWDPDLQDWE